MRKIGKWLGLVALTLPIHAVIALAVTGVPKPPALTTESVGRVAWGPLLANAGDLWRSRESKSLITWMPDGSGVLVQGKRMVLDARLHTLSAAGEEPAFLPRIPRNATVHSAYGRDYMVLAFDTDGDEQFRLYRWDLGDSEPVLLTSADERAAFGAFEPRGERIAYTSTRRNGTDFDIYLMDAFDPTSDERILEVEGMWGVAGWSPNVDELLLVHVRSNAENDLYSLDLGTRALRPITDSGDEPVSHGSVQWSRDGSALYYTSDRGSEFAHLRRLDLVTGEETILSEEIAWDVVSVQQSGDGQTLLLAVNEDGSTKHYTSDPLGEEMKPLELFSSGPRSGRVWKLQRLTCRLHGWFVTRRSMRWMERRASFRHSCIPEWVKGPGPSSSTSTAGPRGRRASGRDGVPRRRPGSP
jgi:dipeptidyl aminopeptidase/acylaminoacyl peptidase